MRPTSGIGFLSSAAAMPSVFMFESLPWSVAMPVVV